MADHAPAPSHGMGEHNSTYKGFITGSVALSVICIYVLVALVAFRFVPTFNVLIGFAGLTLGLIAVFIDSRLGSWKLSGGLLVLFALLVAFRLS